MKSKTIVICHAQIPFENAGAERLVSELCSQLILKGHSVEIVQLPFKWYPIKEIFNSIMSWRLLDITEANGKKIDLVICTKFPSYVIKHPNKVIWLIHQHRHAYDLLGTGMSDFDHIDTLLKDKYVGQIMNVDKKTINESKKVFTISKNVTNRLKKFNNIDSKVLYPAPKNNEKFKHGEYGDYIFVAGRLDSLKRYELMINAMKYIKSNISFIIAGRGPEKETLEKLIKKNNLQDKVILKGYVDEDELVNLYSKSLAVYFAPYDEDYGFITIEAFKSKKPVLTLSDSGGVLEFVENKLSGFVIKNDGNEERVIKELARKADYMYNHKDICKKFGEYGYKKVKGISWDRIIKELVE